VLADVIDQFYPYYSFFRDELGDGRLPLWNPYVLNGTPFLASTVSAVFAPLNWLLLILPITLFWEWSAFIKMVLGSSGIFFFCRRIGLRDPPAFAAGCIYLFSGYFMYFLLFPNTWVASLLGWGMLAAEDFIRTYSRRSLAFFGLILGSQYLGGHVESALLCHMAYLLYVLFRDWRRILPVLVTSVFGFLLAAVVVIPFLEFLFQSATYLQRSAGGRNPYYVELHKWPALIIPHILGSPIKWKGITPYPLAEGMIYIGVLPLFLVPFSWAWKEANAIVQSLTVILLGSILILFGIYPFFDLFTSFPILRQGNHLHITQVMHGMVAILAGIGLTALQERRYNRTRTLLFAGVATLLLLWAVYLSFDPRFNLDAARQSYFFLNWRFSFPLYPFWVLVSFFSLLVFFHKRLLVQGATFLVIGNGFLYALFFNPVVSAWDTVEPTPELVQELREDPNARMVAISPGAFVPNYFMRWNLRDVRGYESVVVDRIPEIYTRLTEKPFDHHQLIPSLDQEKVRLLEKLGCSVIVSPTPVQLEGLKQLTISDFPSVYQVAGGRRVFLTGEIVPASSRQDALAKFLGIVDSPNDDRVVIEGPDAAPMGPVDGSVKWLLDEPQKVRLETESDAPGWLVLRDTFYPGWTVTVAGQPQEIARADYLFRAVPVPAGRHIVEFRYEPRSVYYGAAVSVSTLFLLLFLARRSR